MSASGVATGRAVTGSCDSIEFWSNYGWNLTAIRSTLESNPIVARFRPCICQSLTELCLLVAAPLAIAIHQDSDRITVENRSDRGRNPTDLRPKSGEISTAITVAIVAEIQRDFDHNHGCDSDRNHVIFRLQIGQIPTAIRSDSNASRTLMPIGSWVGSD